MIFMIRWGGFFSFLIVEMWAGLMVWSVDLVFFKVGFVVFSFFLAVVLFTEMVFTMFWVLFFIICTLVFIFLAVWVLTVILVNIWFVFLEVTVNFFFFIVSFLDSSFIDFVVFISFFRFSKSLYCVYRWIKVIKNVFYLINRN